MEAKARLSYLHIAPRKVRLVASLLKGMDVKRAELELRNLSKRASMPLEKLLKSAIQNAVHDLQQDPSRLYVKMIYVDAGPVMKRQMPRAFGRGAPIRKRMSHVSLVLGVRGEEGAGRAKAKKTSAPEMRAARNAGEPRLATWREVESGDLKGEVKGIRAKSRGASPAAAPHKRTGSFGKKIFTRKVI